MDTIRRIWGTIVAFEVIHALCGGWQTVGWIVGGGAAVIWAALIGHPVIAAFFGALAIVFVIFGIMEFRRRDPKPKNRSKHYGKHLEKKVVRLTDLADERGVIDGRTIDNCDVFGPAVVIRYAGEASGIDESTCKWMVNEPRNWQVATTGTDPQGSVRLRNTIIRNSRLYNIGVVVKHGLADEREGRTLSLRAGAPSTTESGFSGVERIDSSRD